MNPASWELVCCSIVYVTGHKVWHSLSQCSPHSWKEALTHIHQYVAPLMTPPSHLPPRFPSTHTLLVLPLLVVLSPLLHPLLLGLSPQECLHPLLPWVEFPDCQYVSVWWYFQRDLIAIIYLVDSICRDIADTQYMIIQKNFKNSKLVYKPL